jgi:hypothetical protein
MDVWAQIHNVCGSWEGTDHRGSLAGLGSAFVRSSLAPSTAVFRFFQKY